MMMKPINLRDDETIFFAGVKQPDLDNKKHQSQLTRKYQTKKNKDFGKAPFNYGSDELTNNYKNINTSPHIESAKSQFDEEQTQGEKK